MNKEAVIKELNELIKEGKEVLGTKHSSSNGVFVADFVNSSSFYSWKGKVLAFLKSFVSSGNEYVVLIEKQNNTDFGKAEICVKTVENIRDYVIKDIIRVDHETSASHEEELRNIFKKFFRVARQLQQRHEKRSTLSIEDEYDVQDLLHALLHLYFDDIRAEEWTPSYAGKAARVDFLLKKEQIVIEVKKTRNGLTDKQVGDELIIDVDRYKSIPDCKHLICFVYDPEGRIGNPIGIMEDLNKAHKGFATVIIEPIR